MSKNAAKPKIVKPARIRTTDAEIRAAVAEARSRAKTATRIVSAFFDAKGDAIIVKLSTGGTLIVPRSKLPGINKAPAGLLGDLRAQKSGFSVWSDKADMGARVETLFEAVAGDALATIAARLLAARTSPARAAASRANGLKGGRPPKAAESRPKKKVRAAA
ncbi:MAG TPA: hypothetical protein VFB22_13720 [Candidatus Baltobacteraceae bacterium]|nr:hypothetical protein [Candidatus Baltobacteraceae bacterium]